MSHKLCKTGSFWIKQNSLQSIRKQLASPASSRPGSKKRGVGTQQLIGAVNEVALSSAARAGTCKHPPPPSSEIPPTPRAQLDSSSRAFQRITKPYDAPFDLCSWAGRCARRFCLSCCRQEAQQHPWRRTHRSNIKRCWDQTCGEGCAGREQPHAAVNAVPE